MNWHKNCLVCLCIKTFYNSFLNFRILVMSLFTKYLKNSKKFLIALKPKNVKVLWAYYFKVFVFHLFIWENKRLFCCSFYNYLRNLAFFKYFLCKHIQNYCLWSISILPIYMHLCETFIFLKKAFILSIFIYIELVKQHCTLISS